MQRVGSWCDATRQHLTVYISEQIVGSHALQLIANDDSVGTTELQTHRSRELRLGTVGHSFNVQRARWGREDISVQYIIKEDDLVGDSTGRVRNINVDWFVIRTGERKDTDQTEQWIRRERPEDARIHNSGSNAWKDVVDAQVTGRVVSKVSSIESRIS